MKNFIKQIFVVLAKILYQIYSYDISIYLFKKKNIFYSFWVKNAFRKCGENFTVISPIYLKGGKYISVGNNFNAMNMIRLECWDEYLGDYFSPSLVIGDNVSMNNNIHIGCIDKIYIGNNVLFASNIFITDHFHGYTDERDVNVAPFLRKLFSKGEVKIMDDVWIGENVTILPNVTIGKCCTIGANSVVTKSFPDYSVVAGVPAKLIRTINK